MYATPISPAMRYAEQLRISRETLAYLERMPQTPAVRVAVSLAAQRIARYETLYLNCEG